MTQKDQKLVRKFTFGIFKFKFQNRLKLKKTSSFGRFFKTKRPVKAIPPKKCGNNIADFETCEQNGDFDSWVGRGLN